jgi:FkbH-like protein
MAIDGEFFPMSGKMDNGIFKSFRKKSISSPSDYAKASMAIENYDSPDNLRLGFLASYTSEVFKPYIIVELAKNGYKGSLYFSPFNQFEQEIFDKDSELYRTNPDFVIIHNRIEDNHPNLISRFAKYSDSDLFNISEEIILRYKLILESLRANSKAKIILINFGNIQRLDGDFNSSPLHQSQKLFFQKLNSSLLDLSHKISSCYVIDYEQIFLGIGTNNSIDTKLLYLARIPFNIKAQIAFGKIISNSVKASLVPPAKCLVLDLDDTLWGGIIGEDGIGGIRLGNDYPGNIFKDFQRYILGLRDQGVLLSIASKNNYSDVMEVFEKHTDCLLKKDDFSSIQIHWENKAVSISKISEDLNIGLNSIVFFDDNAVEREWIRKQLPDVRVIEVPKNPMDYVKSINQSSYFDRLTVTNEDRTRAEIYNQDKKRNDSMRNSISVDDFLKDLEMKVKIGYLNDITITRIVQLINKTNQFNLTTKRYSSEDLNKLIKGGGKIFWLSAMDKYGDNGIVGVAILVKVEKKAWLIENILLSCRVIGRKLETVFLDEIIQILKSNNIEVVYGEYKPTIKNKIVSDFYNLHNFQLTDKKNNLWKFDIKENYIIKPNYVEVSVNND